MQIVLLQSEQTINFRPFVISDVGFGLFSRFPDISLFFLGYLVIIGMVCLDFSLSSIEYSYFV